MINLFFNIINTILLAIIICSIPSIIDNKQNIQKDIVASYSDSINNSQNLSDYKDNNNINNNILKYDDIKNDLDKFSKNPSPRLAADILIKIDNSYIDTKDKDDIETIKTILINTLRELIIKEVHLKHQQALNSKDFYEGQSYLKQSMEIVALFPISDQPEIMEQAEKLMISQKNIENRLLLLRKQRYNYWAATQLQNAIIELRSKNENKLENTVDIISYIEPSFLEPAVHEIYTYVLKQISDEVKEDKKPIIVKKIVNPDKIRKSLEDF